MHVARVLEAVCLRRYCAHMPCSTALRLGDTRPSAQESSKREYLKCKDTGANREKDWPRHDFRYGQRPMRTPSASPRLQRRQYREVTRRPGGQTKAALHRPLGHAARIRAPSAVRPSLPLDPSLCGRRQAFPPSFQPDPAMRCPGHTRAVEPASISAASRARACVCHTCGVNMRRRGVTCIAPRSATRDRLAVRREPTPNRPVLSARTDGS
eukprot:scaffold439_cov415-Prasinococcus_capsulatus_cf.AAC.57